MGLAQLSHSLATACLKVCSFDTDPRIENISLALFSLKLFFSFKKLTILFPKLDVLSLPCIIPPALRLHSISNVTTKDIGADGTFHLTALFQILRYITSNSAVRIDIFKQN